MFVKEAKQWNADFVLLQDDDIQVVCNAGQAVTKLVSAKESMLEIGDKVRTPAGRATQPPAGGIFQRSFFPAFSVYR